jgi:hypothetical protein
MQFPQISLAQAVDVLGWTLCNLSETLLFLQFAYIFLLEDFRCFWLTSLVTGQLSVPSLSDINVIHG